MAATGYSRPLDDDDARWVVSSISPGPASLLKCGDRDLRPTFCCASASPAKKAVRRPSAPPKGSNAALLPRPAGPECPLASTMQPLPALPSDDQQRPPGTVTRRRSASGVLLRSAAFQWSVES